MVMEFIGAYPSKPYFHDRTEKLELISEISSSGLSGTLIGSTSASSDTVVSPSSFVALHVKFVASLIPEKMLFFKKKRKWSFTIFFKKRVDYSHGFSSVFFFDTPEVTKIVLPKVLQNFILFLLAQGTEPKRFFFFFPRNIQYWARLKGLSVFSALCDFFLKKFFPKGSPVSFFQIIRFFEKIHERVLNSPIL